MSGIDTLLDLALGCENCYSAVPAAADEAAEYVEKIAMLENRLKTVDRIKGSERIEDLFQLVDESLKKVEELETELKTAKNERDDARRKQIALEVLASGFSAKELVESRGWSYLYSEKDG